MLTRNQAKITFDFHQSLLAVVLLCGIALLLSLPPARQVRTFEKLSLFSNLPIYFYAHSLLLGIFGLNTGTLSARSRECGWLLVPLFVTRIAIAQIGALPYFVVQSALHPANEVSLILVVLYTTLVSLALALFGKAVENPENSLVNHAFPIKYGVFILYYVGPLPFLPLASPLGGAASLISQGFAPLTFAVPIGLLLGIGFLSFLKTRSDHRV